MPIKRCVENQKLGYKWGDTGKCYTYTLGDESSRLRAREKALAQGRAQHARASAEKKTRR